MLFFNNVFGYHYFSLMAMFVCFPEPPLCSIEVLLRRSFCLSFSRGDLQFVSTLLSPRFPLDMYEQQISHNIKHS